MNFPPVRQTRTLVALLLICTSVLGVLSTAQSNPAPLPAKTMRQIEAMEAEKAARTPAQQRLDSQLWYTLKMSRGQAVADGVPALRTHVAVDAAGKTLVDIDADVTPVLLREITQFGGQIVSEFPQYRSIRANMPLASLEALAGLPGVEFVKPPVQAMISDGGPARKSRSEQFADQVLLPSAPHLSDHEARAAHVRTQLTDALDKIGRDAAPLDAAAVPETAPVVDPEGDDTLAANTARHGFSVDGTGVTIGVLSNGVNSLAAAQSAGALGPVTVLSGQAGSGDEGTAMLEIVHALAPGAKLYYATGFGGEAQFASNIVNLQAAGCNIIVDDVAYLDESPFQDGVVAQAVNTVTAHGAMYFSSAGNDGNIPSGTSSVWEGDFADSGQVLGDGRGGAIHDFGGGVFDPINDPNSQGTSSSGLVCCLFWSDPLKGASDDYDLYDYDNNGDLLNSSTNTQNGSQDPIELMPVDTDGNNLDQVLVVKYSGAGRFLHLDLFGGNGAQLSYFWTSGRTRGHNAGLYTIGVAAADSAQAYPNVFTSSANVESFSSEGERRIFFKPDGTPITPGNVSSTGGFVVNNPDITAADDVTTTVTGFAPFFGTSAAAPHAAAIAALIKSYDLTLTPLEVQSAMDTTATDIWTSGFDTISGNGIVNAFNAVASVASYVKSVMLNPMTVTGGMNSIATVMLSKASSKSIAVNISSDSADATVPASVTVPAGETSFMFTITTKQVSSAVSAGITVGAAGLPANHPTVTLTIDPPEVETLTLSPSTAVGGATVTGTVTLNAPASPGGALIALTSSDTAAATVPSSVTIPQGETDATFTVTTHSVTAAASVTISAAQNGSVQKTATLMVEPLEVASVALNPVSVVSGATATGTVTLNGPAPSGGATVMLTGSDTAAANVPTSVVVSAGADTATFTVATKSIAATTNVTVTATLGGSDMTATLTIDPLEVQSITLNPMSVINGGTVTGTITLNGDAPSGGTVVTLSSNNAAATVPASVTVIANTNSATFTVATHSVTENTSVTITSGLDGSSKTSTLTVQPLELESLSISPDEVTGGSQTTGTVTLNGEAGAEGTVVTLTSENSAEAAVPASVTVPSGSSTATFTIITHAVAVDDDVTITASAGGVSKMEMLTVDAPGVSNLTLAPATVVGGASSTGTVTIDSSAPVGGFPIALSSSNTAATVPANVTIPQNATSATFTITTKAVTASTSVTIKASTTRAFFTAGLTVTPSGSSVPTITSFTPASGPVGTAVTITGTNLKGATVVGFQNAHATSFTVNSAGTQITTTVPSGAITGPIAVATPGGTAHSSASFTVTTASGPPTITGFSPTSGPVGTSVTITGTNLTGATVVGFQNAHATSFTVVSSTEITTSVPSGAATGPIAVATPSGTAHSSASFTVTTSLVPAITSFTPASGPVGTSVTIMGTNFTGATAVKFNATAATTFHVASATSITATLPSGATTGKISVTTPGGTATSSATFTMTASGVPTITSFTPASGSVGTAVTITGTNLTGATVVGFQNAHAASFTVNGAGTQITTTVPSGAVTGPIAVLTPGGEAKSVSSFTVH